MYVPSVLVAGVIVPVAGSIVKPAGAEYTPPTEPVWVTATEADDVQNGLPKYAIVADGAVVIVTLAVVLNNAQPPAATIV